MNLFALEQEDQTFTLDQQEAASYACQKCDKKPGKNVPAPTPSGMPLSDPQPLPSILKSARMETGDAWDYKFTFAFNEYYATEEGIEIATRGDLVDGYLNPLGAVAAFDFDYHPGFQLGFIVNTPYDKWSIGAEYLWFRSHSHSSENAPGSNFYFSPFFNGDFEITSMKSFKADWKLGIDLLDFYVARPFYAGMKWSVEPLFGLRGGWVRQYFHIAGKDAEQQAVLKSNAWMIGPRGGLQSNWLLGAGFSLFGDLSASLLYTKYPTISVRDADPSGSASHGTYNGYSSLTTNLDTGLGVRWGSYFSNQSYYFDLSAAYNFSVFFSQNQPFALNATLQNISGFSPGNLYLHGVSIETSILF